MMMGRFKLLRFEGLVDGRKSWATVHVPTRYTFSREACEEAAIEIRKANPSRIYKVRKVSP